MSSNDPREYKAKQDSQYYCPYCGQPTQTDFCPNCAKYRQSFEFAKRRKKRKQNPKTSWIIFGVIAFIIILGSIKDPVVEAGVSASPGRNTSTSSARASTVSPTATITPSPTPYHASDSFKESVLSVIAYHEGIAAGDASEAESAGKMAAFKMNLGMHKMMGSESLDYRVYFYALYGKSDYLSEFSEDALLSDVEGYFINLLGEASWQEKVSMVEVNRGNAQKQEAYDKDEYIKSAETVSYDKLVRNPSDYKGKILKVTVKIAQVMGEGSWLFQSAYHGYESSSSNEWYIVFDLPEDAARILEDDRVIFYGEFTGLKSVTRALTQTTELIPSLEAKYFVMK